MHFPRVFCIIGIAFLPSSNTCFNRARGRQENEGSIRFMLKQTYHTACTVVRGITCTHDDDVDDRNPKTAFFWDMLVGYHRQINMH